MKKIIILSLCVMAVVACTNSNKITEITENLRFCEGTLSYDGGLLISNFGGEELNPLNTDGKGYIAFLKDDKVSVLIPPSGILSAPKGLAVKDNHLFIADVNKVVVYDLDSLTISPQVITFPAEDLFINALAVDKDTMYVTVTNTGHIYSLDVSDVKDVAYQLPALFADVVGANGIVVDGEKIYVASYPADGVTKDENTIYVLTKNGDGVVTEKLIERAGQYDGLVLSKDKKHLYFSSWVDGEIGKIALENGEVDLFVNDIAPVGPAAMSLLGDDKLAVPDLPNSKVLIVPIK
ncbi:MAG: hypothetical protein RR363_07165 [Rikenellaceae bacterium]